MSSNDFGQKRNSERRYYIDMDSVTKHNMVTYIVNELNYYNEVVNGLNSKLRVFPNEILAIKDRYERLWATIAQTGVDIRNLVRKDISEWPQEFVEFKSTIIENNRLAISDKMLMLYDIARTPSVIHPLIRRAIATEVLRWIMPQVKAIVDSHKNINGHMNAALQLLQPLELKKKRNLQLFKNLVDVKYDKELNESTIQIPYAKDPFVIKNQDLTKVQFDNVVIKYLATSKITQDTKWHIVLKEGSGRYMLDYMDSINKI